MGRHRTGAGWAALAVMTAVLVTALPTGEAGAQSPPAPGAEDRQAERDRLFQAILKDPSNLDLLYAYAQVTIALGDYDAAIASYERMLIFNPNLPRIHLEVGVLYFRAGSPQVARYHLELAKADATATPEVVARVDEYLAQIDSSGGRHQFDGSVFGGLRYQSNANAGPPSGTRVQLGGLPGFADLDEGTAQSDYIAVISGTVNRLYDFGNQTYDGWDSNLFFYGAAFAEQENLNLATTELRTGPKFNHALTRDLSLKPYASVSWVGLDDATYYWSYGGGLNLEYAIAPGLTTTLDGQYRRREFNAAYEDREGAQYVGQFNLRWILGPQDLVTLGSAVVRTTANAEWRASFEAGGSLAYTHLFTDLREFLGAPLAATVYGGGRYTGYDGPDPFIQPDTTRVDRELRGGASLVLALETNISLVASAEYRDVESSVDFYSFDNLSVTMGLLYRF